jgi:hypothetical protein
MEVQPGSFRKIVSSSSPNTAMKACDTIFTQTFPTTKSFQGRPTHEKAKAPERLIVEQQSVSDSGSRCNAQNLQKVGVRHYDDARLGPAVTLRTSG